MTRRIHRTDPQVRRILRNRPGIAPEVEAHRQPALPPHAGHGKMQVAVEPAERHLLRRSEHPARRQRRSGEEHEAVACEPHHDAGRGQRDELPPPGELAEDHEPEAAHDDESAEEERGDSSETQQLDEHQTLPAW